MTVKKFAYDCKKFANDCKKISKDQIFLQSFHFFTAPLVRVHVRVMYVCTRICVCVRMFRALCSCVCVCRDGL